MEYNKLFKDTLNCFEDYDTIGLGNPNSKILFIGKEAGIEIHTNEDMQQIKEKLKELHGSALQWKSKKYDYLNNPKELKELSDTWQNYQQIFGNIFEDEKSSQQATFLKRVFTTEMSNYPSKTTDNAKKNPYFKEELIKRKNTFFKTDFIQGFPVVVLACSDYLVNNKKTREIDSIFGVKYSGEFKNYSIGNWLYIHYNEDKSKLVIHTRQLSANVNNELLTDIGIIIKNHLIKINIIN